MQYFVIILIFLQFWVGPVWAQNDHGIPTSSGEQGARDHNAHRPYVSSGCLHLLPVSSLTIAAEACDAYVTSGPAGKEELAFARQIAAALTIPDVTGTHWIAMDESTFAVRAGYTRPGLPNLGGRYLLQQSATQPAPIDGVLVVTRLEVAASVLTSVTPFAFRSPHDAVQREHNVRNWAPVVDGVTDNRLAMKQVLDAACFKKVSIYYSPGAYAFDSTGGTILTEDCTDVTLRGAGSDATTILVTGVADTGIFHFRRGKRLTVQGIGFVGNNILPGDCAGIDFSPSGGALLFDNTAATETIGQYRVENNTFTDFAGNAWVKFNTLVAQDMEHIYVRSNRFTGGNAQCPGSAAINSQMIWLLSSFAGGDFRYYWIEDNELNAFSVQGGIIIQDNVLADMLYGSIDGNVVQELGQDFDGDTPPAGALCGGTSEIPCNAYAIALYGGTQHTSVTNNHIPNPYTTGIYSVGNFRLTIAQNTIFGQQETNDTTLLRGAIAVSLANQITVAENNLRNNAIAINFQPLPGAANGFAGTVSGNTISTGADGIRLRRGNTEGGGVVIDGNHITSTTATAINLWAVADNSIAMSKVTVSNNTMQSNGNCMDAANDNFKHLIVANNVCQTGGDYSLRLQSGSSRGVVIADNIFAGGDIACLHLNGGQQYSITGNILDDCGTGVGGSAFSMANTQGQFWGNTVVNPGAGAALIASTAGEDLGAAFPTFTSAEAGTRVQFFETGTGNVEGWQFNGTAWMDIGRTGAFGGAAPPTNCQPGAVFVDTDPADDTNCTTTADNSLCVCIATNTWITLENN